MKTKKIQTCSSNCLGREEHQHGPLPLQRIQEFDLRRDLDNAGWPTFRIDGFIRAINTHGDLLHACRMSLAQLVDDSMENPENVIKFLRKVITQAEGGI